MGCPAGTPHGRDFNLAVFAAGVLGAALLGLGNGLILPVTMTVSALVALLVVLLVVLVCQRSIYPRTR